MLTLPAHWEYVSKRFIFIRLYQSLKVSHFFVLGSLFLIRQFFTLRFTTCFHVSTLYHSKTPPFHSQIDPLYRVTPIFFPTSIYYSILLSRWLGQ